MARRKGNWIKTPAGRYIPLNPRNRRISRSKTLIVLICFSFMMVGFFSFLFGKLVITLLIKVFTVKPF